jgi:hypothetical protein
MSTPEPPKQTGLICPNCKQPIATIGHIGPTGVTLTCPGCGHRWPVREQPQRVTTATPTLAVAASPSRAVIKAA